MRILIIEDDEHLRLTLKKSLESDIYTVDHAGDGAAGSYIARTNNYNLIIIDYVLPSKNGMQIIDEIRYAGIHTPILAMSVRGAVEDKVALLDRGADDYLCKPFTYSELLARVKALTRRHYAITTQTLIIDDVTINLNKAEVLKDGNRVYLTRKEFLLLETLGRYRGQVVTRKQLLDEVWDKEADPFSNTIETHVRNLRKKVQSPERPFIHTIPGRGYMLTEGES